MCAPAVPPPAPPLSSKIKLSQKVGRFYSLAIMLLCPTERARTAADAQELKLLYAKFSSDTAPTLDALLQAAQSNSDTEFYFQVDPDAGKGSKRSMVSAAAATVSPDRSWCHLQYVASPLARRVSFLADVLQQLERGHPCTLCTASVRPSYLASMMELGTYFVSLKFLSNLRSRFSSPQLLPS